MWDGFWLLTYTKKKHFNAEQDPMYILAQFMSAWRQFNQIWHSGGKTHMYSVP